MTGACGRHPIPLPCSSGPSPRSSAATALVPAATRGVSWLKIPKTFSHVCTPAPLNHAVCTAGVRECGIRGD